MAIDDMAAHLCVPQMAKPSYNVFHKPLEYATLPNLYPDVGAQTGGYQLARDQMVAPHLQPTQPKPFLRHHQPQSHKH